MGKKGIEFFGSTVVIWIFRFISVILILAVIFNFGMMGLGTIQDVKEAETEIIANSLLLRGLAYSANNRIYPGVVDCDKLNEDVLKRTYNQGNENFIAMNLTLYDMNNNVIKSVVYNEKYYHTWNILAKTGLTGSQSAFLVKKNVYVTLENCKKKNGILDMRIARSRR